MKIRAGFVSNSSSSSFTFCFNSNDINTLYAMILKYREYFDLSYSNYENEIHSCTAKDIIEAIKLVMKNNKKAEEWNKIYIQTIDEVIEQYQARIEDCQQELKKAKDKEKVKDSRYTWEVDFYTRDIKSYKDTISYFQRIQKKGLTTAITIGFGDNHGEISGPGIGEIMDYEGRNISLNKDDFAIYIEQNR